MPASPPPRPTPRCSGRSGPAAPASPVCQAQPFPPRPPTGLRAGDVLFLQPAMAGEDRRIVARGGIDQRRAAYRHHGFVIRRMSPGAGRWGPSSRICRKAEVDVLLLPGRVLAGVQIHLDVDIRMQFDEAPRCAAPSHKAPPARIRRDVQAPGRPALGRRARIAAGGWPAGSRLAVPKNSRSAPASVASRAARGAAASQQDDAQVGLQRAQLVADGAFGDVELDGRAAQAAQAGDRFEARAAREGRCG